MFVLDTNTLIYFFKNIGNVGKKLEKQGTPIGNYDILIAGTTLSANATLVTNNQKKFSRVENLKLENWL